MTRDLGNFGRALVAVAVVAWCATQALAQGAGGSGVGGTGSTSGTAGTSGGAESGNVGTTNSAAATQAGAGTQSGAGAPATTQPGVTGTADPGSQTTPAGRGRTDLLLDRSTTTTGRPLNGQGTSGAGPTNLGNQNSANVAVGGPGTGARNDLLSGLQFGTATTRGLTVASIAPGSFFLDSGLRPGDVIVSLGNRPIRSEEEFHRLAMSTWGQRFPIAVWRDGQEQIIYLTLPQEMNEVASQRQGRRYQANRPTYTAGGQAFLGVGFDTQRSSIASVRDVLPGSAAEQAGLRQGDIIVALNGQSIASYQDAIRLIGSMQAGESLEIEFTRRMPNRAQATLGGRPTSGPGATGEGPNAEERFYRGEGQSEIEQQLQQQSLPPDEDQFQPEESQLQNEVPAQEGQGASEPMPPTSSPSGTHELP